MAKSGLDNYSSEEFMRPFVTAWLEKIRLARRYRKDFDDVAEQCKHFYQGATGFMWEPSFRARFMGSIKAPRFKITIAKAFELVAIFGPIMYWRNPTRTMHPRESLEYTPDMFGDPNDPMVQQQFQMIQMQLGQEKSQEAIRNKLMVKALNYLPNEQPGGGLAQHSQTAIVEALVKGRGCLWTEPYQMPSSSRLLVGSFYDSVDDLGIDPDSRDPTALDARWIHRRRRMPIHEVERKFGLPKDSLKGKGNMESLESQGSNNEPQDRMDRSNGGTFDMMEYYEIWSKGGVGGKLSGVNRELVDALDEVMGDHVYMVVAPDVPYFLNAPSERIRSASDEDIRSMMEWPIPFWTDQRWPVSMLDFYPKLDSPWPMAPLAPGLGELMFLNVMISRLCNHIYSSSRDLVAVLRSAAGDVEEVLKNGDDQSVFLLNDVGKSLNEAIQIFQHPPVNFDVWKIIDQVSQQFDRRTGLTELAYGLNPGGVQSRTAADINAKQENMSVRPDHMSQQVETWQTEVADKEKFCLHWFVKGYDLQPLLGQVGGQLWDQHIANEDPEIVVREMRATLEANSAKKPNKQRDTSNLNAVMPVLFPELSKHADVTHDTNPLNELLRRLGNAHEMDMEGLTMGPRQPAPPPPEAQQQMQQQAQMEMAKIQSEVTTSQIEAQIKQVDMQIKQIDLQIRQLEAQAEAAGVNVDMQKAQMGMQADMQKTQMGLQADMQRTQLEMQRDQAKLQLEMQSGQNKMALDRMKAEADAMKLQQKALQDKLAVAQGLRQDQVTHAQELSQDQEKHVQELVQAEETHQQSLTQAEDQGALNIAISRQMAKTKATQAKKPASNNKEKQ